MHESPNEQNLDVVYEQLDKECHELEKRIATVQNIIDSYKQSLSENKNFQFILSDEDSVNIVKQYQIKWLHNNYLLSMLDMATNKEKAVISREGHFRIMYQILGYSKAGNLAGITMENIASHENISKRDFVITFFDSFHESMIKHDQYFKQKNEHLMELTEHHYTLKSHIKDILKQYHIDSNEDKVKILLNAVHHLFSGTVIDRRLSLNEEKVIQELEKANTYESKDRLFFFIPLKEMLTLYLAQINY